MIKGRQTQQTVGDRRRAARNVDRFVKCHVVTRAYTHAAISFSVSFGEHYCVLTAQ